MNEATKLYAVLDPIVIYMRAKSEYAEPSPSDIFYARNDPKMMGYHRIVRGGLNGDVLFNGYAAEGAKVTLKDAALRTTLTDLEDDDIFEIVQEIVQTAVSHIGMQALGSLRS